jgi:transcription factor E2F3
MRKGIQPALEQYLVTTGGGEGAAVVTAATAASMDKRALLASPGFAAASAAALVAYTQIVITNTSTTSCSSSLQSGAFSAGPLHPCVPGTEPTAGSLLHTKPQGPSSRAAAATSARTQQRRWRPSSKAKAGSG